MTPVPSPERGGSVVAVAVRKGAVSLVLRGIPGAGSGGQVGSLGALVR